MRQRQQANVALTTQIRNVFVASDTTYGTPRIRADSNSTSKGHRAGVD